MSRTAATFAVCVLALAAPLAAQADQPAIADELVAGGSDRHQRMTVPVRIEGEGPFHFLIDTGAQATVVTRSLRDRLNLPTAGRATLVGMAARKEVELVQLDGLEFAARVFDAIEAPLLEAQHVGADGILGLDSLQDLRVLIDFRDHTIAVNDARALGGDRGYEIVVRARNKLGRLIITNATVDGVKTAVIIDTGAQGSVGNRELQRRLRARERAEVTTTDVTGATLTGSLAYARTIEIDRMRLSGVPITYAEAPAFAALGLAEKPAMVLGMGDLRAFDRIAIDFAQRTVLFDLPAGAQRRL
jgi:predicted aspartyl protease